MEKENTGSISAVNCWYSNSCSFSYYGAKITDIYPTMLVVYSVVFLITGITCFVGYRRSR